MSRKLPLIALAAILALLAPAGINGHPRGMNNEESAIQTSPKVKLSLYYESLCGGCKHFIVEQLGPNFDKFAKYLDVHLNPFGNTQMTHHANGWKFDCQHGPTECQGSILEACLIEKLNSTQNLFVPIIACMENSDPTLLSTAKKCMAESGIGPEDKPSIDEISKCAYGQEGIELFAKLGKETPKHKWVPWVELNDHYDRFKSQEATYDLPGALCRYFLSDVPECQST